MNRIKAKHWDASLWSDGYFCENMGRVTSDAIKYHTMRQHEKLWSGRDYYVIARRKRKQDDFLS